MARGLQPGASVVAEISRHIRSQHSDHRGREPGKSADGQGTPSSLGTAVQPIRQVQRGPPLLLLPAACPCGKLTGYQGKDRLLKSTFTCFGNPLPLLPGWGKKAILKGLEEFPRIFSSRIPS